MEGKHVEFLSGVFVSPPVHNSDTLVQLQFLALSA